MLCDLCANISFAPLRETGYSFRPGADRNVVQKYGSDLFYFHHCCVPCVAKAANDGCRLCGFLKIRLRWPEGAASDDGLCAALNLPGAGVWVILRQEAGDMARTTDGRRFRARSEQRNASPSASFSVHYDRTMAPVMLKRLWGASAIFFINPGGL